MASPHFASAHSTDPRLRHAADEAVASLLERLGPGPPDLLVVFAAGPWDQDVLELPDLGAHLKAATGARHVLGCTAGACVEGMHELEGRAGLSLFAAVLPGARLTPARIEAQRQYGGSFTFEGLPDAADPREAGLLLLGDPFTFPMPAFLPHLAKEVPGMTVAGAMASGGTGPGTHLLYLDGESSPEGAIGMLLEGDIELISAVSQGCRPVGEPYVVTAAERTMVQKLRGKPAAEMMMRTIGELPDPERELFQAGAFLGLAMDPTRSEFRASDLLVRNIMGFHPQSNAIAVAAPEVRTGMTVQFMVRDSASASDELERLLSAGVNAWNPDDKPMGALLFTCGGRGRGMFDEPDHDARAVQAELGPGLPLAGLFAGGEIGMIGGRPFLHGFTASVALLRERRKPVIPDAF